MVYSLFVTDGDNNHIVTQGIGECKYMTLHTDDEEPEIKHMNDFLKDLTLNELRKGVLHQVFKKNNTHSCTTDMY